MIFVLDQMQVLDQEIAPPRPVTQQNRNLFSGLGIDLTALGGRFRPPAPLAGMFERADLMHIMIHRNVSFMFQPPICSPWHATCQAE